MARPDELRNFLRSPSAAGGRVRHGICPRNDLRLNINHSNTEFADGRDNVTGFAFTANSSNRFRQFGGYYEEGDRGSRHSRYATGFGSIRLLRKLDLGIRKSVFERRGDPTDSLTIVTIGYEMSRTRSVTSRIVQRGADVNFYLAYRSGGLSGAELYVIAGDPNERRTQRRLSVKMVWPF